jgi:PadR family transcriptional regulator PadR
MSTRADGPQGRDRPAVGAGLGCEGPGGGGPGGGRYRRAVLGVAILASLAESTTHGYSLVDQIETLAGSLVCVDPGSMYRLLRALEEDGLVESSWEVPEAGPSRRVYRINEQGLEALNLMAASLSQWGAAMQRLADHATDSVARLHRSDH